MADLADLKQTLDRIAGKASLLAERYRRVVKQRDELREQVEFLTQQIEERDRTIADLNVRVEYLSVVGVTNPTRDDVKQSRAVLLKLVRDIDRCINDLTH